MASSSTSSIRKSFKYDVFLSFRGEKRHNFVDHLYAALDKKNIYTYKDDVRMKKGKRITDDLTESIKDSKIHIIVFSKDYPSSRSCLHELVEIMKCNKETEEYTACPVFYDVTPSEVRDQKGEFGKAFAKIEFKYQMGLFRFAKLKKKNQNGVYRKAFAKLKKEKAFGEWKLALKEAADLAGLELKKTADGREAIFIHKIVEMISLELRSTHFSIDDNLVGMESQIEGVLSLLGTGCDDVCMIGIRGMGGIGKTTLARAVFDRISLQFEGKSFVENVREVSNTLSPGLSSLQTQVLSDVLNDQGMRVCSVSDGKNMLKRMMGGRKVLLVLDDVDHIEQLEALAGDRNWFKPGSVIIITTRDEQVLVAHKVKLIHNVHLLTNKEALCLFGRYAFGREIPIQEYDELSRKVVVYAAGLPLTIKVLGSFLCGKSKLEWIDALERLKKIPLEETQKKLELSYSGLEKEYKEIFLDVACILKGWTKEKAIQALESCGFHARIGLRVLEQKSLITIGYYVYMHDHIEEMGRNIVRRLHPDKPNKHNRLWIREEIEDILINDLGTKATKCMVVSRGMINPPESKLDEGIIMKGLRKMKDLRFIFISWPGASPNHDDISPSFPTALRYMHFQPYPFGFLPKTFEANNLVTLQMPNSDIVELWEGGDEKVLNKLRFLDLSNSKLKILNLGLTPNIETLTLGKCHYLEKLHMPAACLRLKSVYLTESKIRTFHLGLAPDLEKLIFRQLRSLKLFGSRLGVFDLGLTPNIETLVLGKVDGLEVLHMPIKCPKLRFLTLSGLKLRTLDLGPTPNVENLSLSGDWDELHMPIKFLKLTSLELIGLKLRTLDLGLTPNVENLSLSGDLEELLMPIECPKLKFLTLDGLNLRTLDLGLTPNLEKLYLKRCYDLVELHMPNGCLTLKHLSFEESHLRTLDLRLNINLKRLYLEKCFDLVELHLPDGCLKLENLSCIDSNVRTLDLELSPILKSLELTRCDNLVDLRFPRSCLNLNYLTLSKSKLRTLDMGLIPNLIQLELTNCVYLEELHLADGCQKLKRLTISHSKLSIIDLGSVPNLKYLSLCECNDLLELRMPSTCLNLETVELIANSKLRTLDLGLTPNLKKLYLRKCYNLEELHMASECPKLESIEIYYSKLRTLDLGLTPNLKKLILRNCYNLEELHMADECENLTSLEISHSKLRILNVGLVSNLKKLYLYECDDLVEFDITSRCLNLEALFLIYSKLKTFDLGLTPNLKKLVLGNCYNLEELHMASECPKLESIKIFYSNLRKLDLSLTPNLMTLDLKGCYMLVELHIPIGGLKTLVYLDLTGCMRFKSFLFQIKADTKDDDTDESFQFVPLAELSFILKRCPIHLENKFPKFQFICLHKKDLPSLTRNIEKLISGGFCACEDLERF